MQGEARMVKHLNSTGNAYQETVDSKKFATNTIAFIDSTFDCDGVAAGDGKRTKIIPGKNTDVEEGGVLP
jgi:hypothetical protein